MRTQRSVELIYERAVLVEAVACLESLETLPTPIVVPPLGVPPDARGATHSSQH